MLLQLVNRELWLAIGFVPFQKDLVFLCGVLLCVLLVWRFVKFSVLPYIYPNGPKDLPYWFPFLGHSIAFFSNSHSLLNYARASFGDIEEPFAITVAGSKLYILTSARDIAAAYNNTTTLSYEMYVQAVIRTVGCSEDAIRKWYAAPDPDKAIFPNPNQKPLAKLARDINTQQLFPGPLLDALSDRFVVYFEKALIWDEMKSCLYTRSSAENEIILSLADWTTDMLTSAGQTAYFGAYLADIDPAMPWNFREFDDLTWQVFYSYPEILSKTMHGAKNKLISNFTQYFDAPVEKRGDMAWFTSTLEIEMKNIGLSKNDIATMMMTIYWGINTNTRRGAFWMLSYMLFQPELLAVVRAETKPAFKAGEKLDVKFLEDKCPRLVGIWSEVIRLTAYSSSIRYIADDMVIGGKILRKGHRLMIPNRHLHFDSSVYGHAVREFDPLRFVKNNSLLRGLNWRPYGGGATMCPGRYLAKQSVISFVTLLLHSYDIELVSHQRFPRLEDGYPVLGIMSSKKGDDLLVRIKPTIKGP